MRLAVLFLAGGLAFAQSSDQAYAMLFRAYEALRAKDYDTAVAGFLKGIEAAPQRASSAKRDRAGSVKITHRLSDDLSFLVFCFS